MKKEERLKKLLEKKSDRHAKLNFSTTKEDRLQARIEKIDKQIAELQGDGS